MMVVGTMGKQNTTNPMAKQIMIWYLIML